MPALTIGRMASLYGLHRSTLYEAVDKGRITAQINGKGQKTLDLSEMIRVYGEPPGKASTQQNPTSTIPDTSNTDVIAKFDALLEVVTQQRDELRKLREEVANFRRLPPPRPEYDHQNDAPPPKAVEESDDPHGLRSLARALFKDPGKS